MGLIMNNRNICAKISIICLSVITAILTVDFKYELMPFNTVFLLLYVILVLFLTIWISFVYLQHVLNQNLPFECAGSTVYTQITNAIKRLIITEQTDESVNEERICESIDVRIEKFVGDVEKMFIRKWYSAYISDDEMFLQESRSLLDIVVRRFLQISQQINTDKLMHGTLIVLLKHVKEYRKAVRKSRNIGGSIENQYRYTHVGSKSPKALEHFTMRITSKLMRHFVNWELYNSLACRCVSSILAKKLVTYLLVYTSAPGFLNYRLLQKYGSESCTKKLNRYTFISVSDVDHSEVLKELKQLYEDVPDEECCTPKKSEVIDGVDGVDSGVVEENMIALDESGIVKEVERVESTTPVTCERPMSEPVKIYESRSANKTWRNSRDLDCISLGHDILYLSDMTEADLQQFAEKKQWKNVTDSLEAEEAKPPPSPLPVVKENVQEELETMQGFFVELSKTPTTSSNLQNFLRPATTGAATLITNTIRPIGNVTANTMKEFQQSTVTHVVKPVSQATTNAMHKIGDLQDEAAGVVEGILDFGMAGIRKGLRLTGLQDNIQESIPHKSRFESERRDIPTRNGKQRLTKLGHVNSDEVKADEVRKEEQPEDTVWVNPLLQETLSPSFEGDILLEKSPVDSKSLSRESTKSSDIPIMEIDHVESPDLEYEDTTDLATTTAKLRSLLAQKITESALNTPTASPMSLIPTPIDPCGSSLEELSDVDGALPSMYKAFAKTATGVFQNTLNTLKTALPGNAGDQEGQTGQGVTRPVGLDVEEQQWVFVQSDPQANDLSLHMEKFLSERRVFCTVDNAYEAMEAVEMTDQLDSSLIMSQRQFDDELDDFDTTIPMTKALIDLICELIEDTYPPLVKENIVKVVLLTSGRVLEEWLHEVGMKFLKTVNTFIGNLPKFEAKPLTMPMKIDNMVEMCLDSIPSVTKKILNEDSVKSILKLLLESLQSQRINQDSNLQLLELLASEIITAAGQSSPTYSA